MLCLSGEFFSLRHFFLLKKYYQKDNLAKILNINLSRYLI